MNTEIMTLDDLFAVAKKQIVADRLEEKAEAKKPKRIRTPDDLKPPSETSALFANPDHWEQQPLGVAIIHEESDTLLGSFVEYIHKTVPKCKKLVRSESSLTVGRTERVSGDWWIEKREEVEEDQPWHTKKMVVVDVLLASLQCHSPAVQLIVHLSYGAMCRAELLEDTTFGQLEGTPEQLLFLPKGTNLLPVLSREAKINLKVELELI